MALWRCFLVLLVGAMACSDCQEQGGPTKLVFRKPDGGVLSIADIENYAGTARWEVVAGGPPVPEYAAQLHKEGRKAGGSGDYPRAIELLQRAAALAPQWPYPTYDLAFTYLLMKRDADALKAYEAVDAMAPQGFFTTKTAVDSLRKEAAGTLAKGVYLAYVMLEWAPEAEQAELVTGMVDKFPTFAPGWKEFAILQESDAAALEALERGLALNPDMETRGMLLLNKSVRLAALGKAAEAQHLLNDLVKDPSSTLGVRHLAEATLKLTGGSSP